MRSQFPSPAPAQSTASSCASARLALIAGVVCAAALFAPASFAQPQPPQPKVTHHQSPPQKPAAGQPAQPIAPPAYVAPPQPEWPANNPPAPPAVTYNSMGLHIVADNSSLSSILKQVSTETGAKVEGLSGDERIFGDYGPGQPREILAQLLVGVNYNVLILGDEALGEPLHVLLSPRPNGPTQAGNNNNNRPQSQEPDEDFQPEPEEQPYQPPAPVRPPMNQPQQPFNNRPMTPQERLQEIQERQREMQQQQQQQPPPPQD